MGTRKTPREKSAPIPMQMIAADAATTIQPYETERCSMNATYDSMRPTSLLFPGFGAYSLDFTLACWIARFTDQFAVQHELRKRVLKRLRAEGVESPFPTAVRLARSD
jgi:hypothetical protein